MLPASFARCTAIAVNMPVTNARLRAPRNSMRRHTDRRMQAHEHCTLARSIAFPRFPPLACSVTAASLAQSTPTYMGMSSHCTKIINYCICTRDRFRCLPVGGEIKSAGLDVFACGPQTFVFPSVCHEFICRTEATNMLWNERIFTFIYDLQPSACLCAVRSAINNTGSVLVT